jgi:hypothetical protein
MKMQYLITMLTSQLREEEYSYELASHNKQTPLWQLREMLQRILAIKNSLILISDTIVAA